MQPCRGRCPAPALKDVSVSAALLAHYGEDRRLDGLELKRLSQGGPLSWRPQNGQPLNALLANPHNPCRRHGAGIENALESQCLSPEAEIHKTFCLSVKCLTLLFESQTLHPVRER